MIIKRNYYQSVYTIVYVFSNGFSDNRCRNNIWKNTTCTWICRLGHSRGCHREIRRSFLPPHPTRQTWTTVARKSRLGAAETGREGRPLRARHRSDDRHRKQGKAARVHRGETGRVHYSACLIICFYQQTNYA